MHLTGVIALLFCIVMKILSMERSSLYRNPNGEFSVGNFHRNQYQYLWVTIVASSMVSDSLDCMFLCVGEPMCYSLNIAAFPDSRDLYRCDLLATDKYRASNKLHSNATFHHYSPRSSCESSPCKNGGHCVPEYEWNSYGCDCKGGFFGKNCDSKGDVMTNRTCSHIKYYYPATRSGFFLIDPDGEGGLTPFKVFCNMTGKNGVGVTLVSHDSEDRILVKGYEEPGSYSRNISYNGAGVARLASLTNQSAHCEQFIQYECYHSILHGYSWWVSRQGSRMNYWEGGLSGHYKCACAAANTCAVPSYGCNCDKNDGVWRDDSGYLTDKSHLPVSQLRFGDTGHLGEEGYHTLGKLKCYGRADI